MKIFKIFLIILALCVFGKASYAQDFAKKIAIVDIQFILDKSVAADDVRKKMSKARDLYQAQLVKKEEELRKDEERLSERRALLPPEKFNEERKVFTDKVIKVQRDFQEKRADHDLKSAYASNQLQRKILEITQKIANEEKIDLVLTRSQTFFSSAEMDITTKVLEILNKETPTIELKKPTKNK